MCKANAPKCRHCDRLIDDPLESDVDLIPCNLGKKTRNVWKKERKTVCLNAVYVLTYGVFQGVMEYKVAKVLGR
jgi:hypothetical protein